MKQRPKILWITVILLSFWFGYILSQQPQVWCSRQWAGIALRNGGYRSWTLSFCDGFAEVDGKWQPVVVETNGYRKGYFSWPKYSHIDIRGLKIINQTNAPQ